MLFKTAKNIQNEIVEVLVWRANLLLSLHIIDVAGKSRESRALPYMSPLHKRHAGLGSRR
ncbi:MAG: hypothetical protein ABIL62_05455 [Planctomycetota bacterium]